MVKSRFNIYEKKFIISTGDANRLLNRVSDRFETDRKINDEGCYRIASIYFDTMGNDMVRHSIQKPKFNELVTLRSYVDGPYRDTVIWEIKKRYYGLVDIRTARMKLNEAAGYMESEILPEYMTEEDREVMRGIDLMRKQHDLKPELFVSFDRESFVGKEIPGMRLTFDFNLASRRYDIDFAHGNAGEELLDEDLCIMQIKSKDSIPEWMLQTLSDLRIYSAGFSKFGVEYLRRIKEYNYASIT
ncbi:MAG: polyphosphate polymerase domain-containing protein [Oscillospiraceae bacterium]|nr:polyphosphate polymerase domain-containing protein [Oscillospiraceae bacterium]